MSKVFIITSSGGGGLLQSAVAIEQEEKKQNPQVKIVKRDLLLDWIKGGLGIAARFYYNWTQKTGRVTLQNMLAKGNVWASALFFPFVFFGALYVFFKEKVDKVYSNQFIAFAAIIKAMRLYNKVSKKNLVLHIVFVDLPTKPYSQFLKGVKYLSKKDREHVQVITIEPLLEKGQTIKEYWEKYCRISEKQIVYKKYPIRESFKKYQNKEREKKELSLKIKTSFLEETNLIKECLEKGTLHFSEDAEGLEFKIHPKDKLFVILLGSQPASNATYLYVKNFIEILKNCSEGIHYHLFVFCDQFFPHKKTIFHKIFHLVETTENYPSCLNIIPMSFQKDDVIATLFHRSDLTITRSGGHTIMELMAVAKKEKWIHSETKKKKKELTTEDLLKGIPFWEAGNACYLKEKFGGDIITPELLHVKMQRII